MKYLANAFSLGMLDLRKQWHHLKIQELGKEEFCRELSNVSNTVGHQGTVDLINQLCLTQLKVNRVNVKLADGDTLIIVQILERLPEGKVLQKEEVERLLSEGKVKFLKVDYYNVYY